MDSVIEENLNAICTTPRIHRNELLELVHRPVFVRIDYSSTNDTEIPLALVSLLAIYNKLLEASYSVAIQKRILSRSLEQLKKFCGKAQHIHEELGHWASDYYIRTSIERLRDAKRAAQQLLPSVRDDEKEFLLKLLQGVRTTQPRGDAFDSSGLGTSQKCQKLIQFLTRNKSDQFHGIVFVEQRATVAVLHKLLSTHPNTKKIIRCGTFVGTSNLPSQNKSLGDWLDTSKQEDTLVSFRGQEKNLIIATSVLEEGIDISACNVVICFNKPANLKSFIQRRGRARKSRSIFVLMLSSDDASLGPREWENLEKKMTEAYQMDAEERLKIQQLEEVEEGSDSRFEIKSTGYCFAET